VRIGLHTGNPHVSDEGYVGEDVHLGARVAAAGQGGQILLTRATAAAAALVSEVTDLGEHRVKDFERPIWIYQLGDVPFPPLKTISNTNLPRPASTFIGREREVAQLAALLRNGTRLLTLTGPGGTGKTRLAIEAAAELVPDFRAGVFWIPLAELRDPALVSDTVARTLGAKDGLADHIGERQMLLLIDNLEQIIQAAPTLAALIEQCPNLRLIVTSRELLRVRGEVEYAVPPLADAEATALFTERASLPKEPVIEELCRRLDNLPLAVELAAARARVLTPAQILERLGDRLDLLKGGRDAEDRQQTLRAAIEWSFDLLDDEEKRLFARLAVFRGGCTLESAQQVAHAEVDALESLVDKSLVRHAGPRFGMLESIHEFATDELERSAEAEQLSDRHARLFIETAVRAAPHLLEADRDTWMDRIAEDHDNFRAALDHLERAGDTQAAMRICGAIVEFWDQRGHHVEALARFKRLLATDVRPTSDRAKALDGASMIATKTDEMELAEVWAQEALRLYREQGDEHGIANQLWGLGFLRLEADDNEAAKDMLAEAVKRFRELGDDSSAMWAMRGLGFAYLVTGDPQTARSIYSESAAMAHAAGDAALEAATTGAQAQIALQEGLSNDAISLTRHSLMCVRRTRDPLIHRSVICNAAAILANLGHTSSAAQVLGYADAQADELGTREPWVERMNDETMKVILKAIGQHGIDAEWQAGRTLTTEVALDVAMAVLDKANERHRN
jgi:predicted ATPase